MQKLPPCTQLRRWRGRQRTEEGVQKGNRTAGGVELFNHYGATKHFNSKLEISLSIRPLLLMPKCTVPVNCKTPYSVSTSLSTAPAYTQTHTLGAHGHFSRNSAWLPPPDWQETVRVSTTSCEYGKRQKIIENLAFMNLWWERGGMAGLCLWLNQSRACVVCVWLPTKVEINRVWTGPRQLQTRQSKAFVLAISPCPPRSCCRKVDLLASKAAITRPQRPKWGVEGLEVQILLCMQDKELSNI